MRRGGALGRILWCVFCLLFSASIHYCLEDVSIDAELVVYRTQPVSVQPLFSSKSPSSGLDSNSNPHSHTHRHGNRHAQDPSTQTFDSAYSSNSTRPLIFRLTHPFSRRSPSSTSTESADPPPPLPSSPSHQQSEQQREREPQPEAMQISVLIAMPSPHRPSVLGNGNGNENGKDMSLKGKARKPSTASWEYEEELPEMVFGVARQALRR